METDIEKLSLRYLLYNPDATLELVKAGIDESFYFTPLSRSLAQVMFTYFQRYKQATTRTAFITGVSTMGVDAKEVEDFLNLSYTEDLVDIDIRWIIDQLIFHKKQYIMKRGIQKVVESIDDPNEAENRLVKVAQAVVKLRAQKDIVVNLNDEISDIIEHLKIPRTEKRILTGFKEFDDTLHGLKPGWLVLFVSRPKVGKCFAKGTKILMYDGTIKKVEDIKEGELVMGNDSTPRIVEGCTSGEEEMYEIRPNKGEPFTVNGSHILTLTRYEAKYGENRFIKVTVNDYLRQRKKFQRWKLYRTGVEFKKQLLPKHLPPYLLGLWLGSCSSSPHYKRCIKSSLIRNTLQRLNLLRDKYIPHIYKINDRKNRLELLAGLIDSDCCLHNKKHKNNYQINVYYDNLKDDILFLARSLGFGAYAHEKTKNDVNLDIPTLYWEITILGNISEIPVRINPKKSPKKLNKNQNPLQIGFKIIPKGRGTYYGFAVNGNSLFLLGDFTVVHNTRTLINIAVNMITRGVNVLVFSLEIPQEQYISLVLSCASGLPYYHIEDHEMSEEEYNILEATKQQISTCGKLTIVDTLGPVSPQYISLKIDELELQHGIKYDVIVVDHGSMMKANVKLDRDDLTQGSIAEDLRAIAREKSCVVLTAVQRKQEAVKKRTQKEDISGSGEDIARSDIWFQTSDVVIIIHKPEDISEQLSKLHYKVISRYSDVVKFEMLKDFEITKLYSSADSLIGKEGDL